MCTGKKSILALEIKICAKNWFVIALQHANQILFVFESDSCLSLVWSPVLKWPSIYSYSKSLTPCQSSTCRNNTKGLAKIQKPGKWEMFSAKKKAFMVKIICSWSRLTTRQLFMIRARRWKQAWCSALAVLCSYCWDFCAEKCVGAGVKPAVNMSSDLTSSYYSHMIQYQGMYVFSLVTHVEMWLKRSDDAFQQKICTTSALGCEHSARMDCRI